MEPGCLGLSPNSATSHLAVCPLGKLLNLSDHWFLLEMWLYLYLSRCTAVWPLRERLVRSVAQMPAINVMVVLLSGVCVALSFSSCSFIILVFPGLQVCRSLRSAMFLWLSRPTCLKLCSVDHVNVVRTFSLPSSLC